MVPSSTADKVSRALRDVFVEDVNACKATGCPRDQARRHGLFLDPLGFQKPEVI